MTGRITDRACVCTPTREKNTREHTCAYLTVPARLCYIIHIGERKVEREEKEFGVDIH